MKVPRLVASWVDRVSHRFRRPVKIAAKEPACCGVPMVHNSWAERWECADAYFTLFDEGWDGGDPRDSDDLNVEVPVKAGGIEDVCVDDLREAGADWLIPYLRHWRASWLPDEAWEGK